VNANYSTSEVQRAHLTALIGIVDLLFARPIISIPALTQEMGVSFVVGRRYVDRLVQIGLLRESTGKARNRLFVAEEILRAVEVPIT
jgi:predicted transcriptional regulator